MVEGKIGKKNYFCLEMLEGHLIWKEKRKVNGQLIWNGGSIKVEFLYA